MLNGERGIPGRPKVVRGSKTPALTSHAGLNPRSCTALSLIDGRETRPRLVHASIARGITASLVSLCEAWLRDGTASYQTKALEMTYGQAVYPASQVLRRVRQEPFLTSYAENNIPQNYVEKQE